MMQNLHKQRCQPFVAQSRQRCGVLPDSGGVAELSMLVKLGEQLQCLHPEAANSTHTLLLCHCAPSWLLASHRQGPGHSFGGMPLTYAVYLLALWL